MAQTSLSTQTREGGSDFALPFIVQSDDIVAPPSGETNEEMKDETNVTFVGNDANTFTPAPRIIDPSLYDDEHTNALLADFMKRPVEISSFSWSTSDIDLDSNAFDPWYEYFNHPAIQRKASNFNFVSGNLHLKFVINATNLLAGLARMTYLPLSGYTPESVPTPGPQQIPLSQRPHVELKPQKNSGGEMILPFFYHQNWLDVTSATDLQAMGRIRPSLFSNLIHANGGTYSITVTCYAWMEDLKMCGPTLELAVQSTDMLAANPDNYAYRPEQVEREGNLDEYGRGPVERTATAIEGVADAVADYVPILAPFATATSAVASAVGWVASLFGWTNVPVIEDVRPMKSLTHHSLASAFIGEPVEKLTLDPKNELTVDPRTVGLDGTDEMALQNIITRDSFITRTTWVGSQPVDSLLCSVGITPALFDIRNSGQFDESIYSTPMGHIQWLFKNWHGDIIVTFQFIHTKFHKGRVRITWDPTGDAVADASTTTTSFTKIYDLSDTDKIEVRVPYLQALPWLETRADLDSAPWFSPNTVSPVVANHHATGFTNGCLSMRVLNTLTGPADPTFCGIVVYARAAENFTFGNPRADLPQHSIYEVQSEDIIEVSTTNSKHSMDKYKSLFCMGEEIRSLRTLLRRSTLNAVVPAVLPASDWVVVHHYQTHEPLYYGYDPNGINSARELVGVGSSNFNFVQVTPYNWVAPLFLGRRGSMFWHYNLDITGNGEPAAGSLRITRRDATFDRNTAVNYTGISAGTASGTMRAFNSSSNPTAAYPRYASGAGGTALTNQITQAGLSAGLPMYTNRRMYFVDWNNATLGNSADGSNTDVFDLDYILRNTGGGGSQGLSLLEKYSSIGTDFNFFYFINVPIHYTYDGAVPTAN